MVCWDAATMLNGNFQGQEIYQPINATTSVAESSCKAKEKPITWKCKHIQVSDDENDGEDAKKWG